MTGLNIRAKSSIHRSIRQRNCHLRISSRIAFVAALLILLCYKNWRRQQGHLGRERARWVAIWRRRVAMECGLWRSVLIGSATGFRTVWQAGWAKLEVGGPQRWGVGRGGKKASFHHLEAVGSNAEAGMVVKAAPVPSFEVAQSKLLLQFLVVALDAPTQL